ncbi:MAG: hypothetical protein J2P55_00385 [Rhizobiales bacterium]|nr:hypothetical protein [Hyphomicrobiales bacterium]
MLRSSGFAAAAASLLLAGAFFFVSQSDARAASGCQDAEFAMLAAPLAPWKGAPLRVLVAAEQALDGELALIAPDGSVAAKSRERNGGPPYFWIAEVATPAAGTWRATLVREAAPEACRTVTREIVVSAQKPPRPSTASGSVWPVRNSWDRATENLFSAWIAKLFDAPLDAEPSWKAWHEVLRDRSRNLLFDYLGLGEDNVTINLRPDCADFAYFLRAYFAYKMALPFGYSNCSRSGKCYQWFNIEHPEATRPPPPPDQITASADPTPAPPTLLQQMIGEQPAAAPATAAPAKRLGTPSFAEYLRIVGDVVHSGSVRTSATDDNTDFYFVPLTQDTLRPGTVYADPYGHVMMVVRRVPESGGAAGILLAVDAEPDGTVARKRFWRGTFLFAHEPTFGSAGFKHFRPIVRGENGALRRLTNAQIAKNPDYADFSPEQSQLAVDDFYDRMDAALSPEPLDPFNAMKEAITALEEQVNTRVTSIENGRKYQDGHGEITMPDGPAIFATNGAWEDFSTPARDFRLLVAIDVVRGYPDRVARHPERYAMPSGKAVAEVKAELQKVLTAELVARKFSYTRSDSSSWTLTLKDAVERAGDLEMAYNPNDCAELRWGAPENSQEASTCKRHASSAQRAKMTNYRAWFHERHWPARV